ncbi:hypothetical protein ACL02R_21075 [Streptomyces sp. MS19]|uniref:hypothetical protein n=1 Tax=Streptomyces sp. MS19 TaxID=3385972 RepID=UPI0039A1DBDE
MPDPGHLHTCTPAPVREENPRITVITGLEGPVGRLRPGPVEAETAVHADAEARTEAGEVGA